METYEILRDLAIILLAAKFMAIVAKKVKAPAVVGEIIAGLIIGPCLLNLVVTSDFISKMAEIGVILIMFSAGLETNLKELKKSGLVAFLIACMGVLVPFVGGSLLYMAFHGWAARPPAVLVSARCPGEFQDPVLPAFARKKRPFRAGHPF